VVELHVRADQVGDDVPEQRLRHVVPVRRVLVHGRRDAAQTRRVGAVAGLQIPHRVGLGHLAAPLDQLVGRRAQLLHPFLRNYFFQKKITLREVVLALLLREHAGLVGKNLFRSHVGFLFEA
jgi:hypothetical protein